MASALIAYPVENLMKVPTVPLFPQVPFLVRPPDSRLVYKISKIKAVLDIVRFPQHFVIGSQQPVKVYVTN